VRALDAIYRRHVETMAAAGTSAAVGSSAKGAA
jgi:hypothetical protein